MLSLEHDLIKIDETNCKQSQRFPIFICRKLSKILAISELFKFEALAPCGWHANEVICPYPLPCPWHVVVCPCAYSFYYTCHLPNPLTFIEIKTRKRALDKRSSTFRVSINSHKSSTYRRKHDYWPQ